MLIVFRVPGHDSDAFFNELIVTSQTQGKRHCPVRSPALCYAIVHAAANTPPDSAEKKAHGSL